MRRLLHRILTSLVGAQSCCALLALGLALPSLAQTVRWDPPGGQLGYNQVSQLSLVFDDCEPDGEPTLPAVDGLQFGRPSQSSQTSIVNFKMSRTFSYVFPVRPGKRAPVIIPAFDVKTDKGTLRVAAARYTVGDAPVGNSGLSVADIAAVTLETPRSSVWAGEVFPVTYNLDVIRRYFHSLGSNVSWESTPAIADDWTKPDPTEALVGGERHVVATQTTRATIKQPGVYTLKPASQLLNLMVGSTSFGLFTQPNVEQRQLDSNALDLNVKALPPAPGGFTGAVGEFTFTSKVVPLTAAVGEPVTWTLELAGVGNWPDISGLPQREVSNEFQVVQPKSKRTMKDGTLFEGSLTEDVVLVPTRAGTYRLPAVRFSYFDPVSGTYKTIASEPVTVTITRGSAPITPPASSGAPVQFSLTPSSPAPNTPELPPAVAPVAPENLPRDPLESSARGIAPLAIRPLASLCLIAAVVLPLLVWIVLAALRSRALDPQRRRREALKSLTATLASLRSSGAQPAAVRAQLQAWQAGTAALWEIPHAAPGTPLVHAGVARFNPDAAAAWSRLWSEADRTLHGREVALPSDWLMRANAALQAVKVPGWNPFSLFSSRYLFPFLGRAEDRKAEGLNRVVRAAIWLILLFSFSALQPSAFGAEPATEAYKRGDFAAAEQAWRTAINSAPTDWTARHNLGLALGQQDRWAEAAAHWTSAFLLNSRSDVTRWDLNLGVQRSGLANPQLVELSRGEAGYRIARAASPGEWQLALGIAALLLAFGLVALLLQGYVRIGRWGKPAALTATLLAIVLAGAATFSLHLYGQLADPDAVFVWKATTLRSIPTEADTVQKTSPLSAGSIAVVEKTFLGWSKLTFPAGQSGWVRNEDLIGLYR